MNWLSTLARPSWAGSLVLCWIIAGSGIAYSEEPLTPLSVHEERQDTVPTSREPPAGNTIPTSLDQDASSASPDQHTAPAPRPDTTQDEPDQAVTPQEPEEPASYLHVTGKIWRVQSGFVFAKTPIGTLTLFSQRGLQNAKPGQRVTLWTQDHTTVVDIHGKHGAARTHRFITGIPVFTAPDHQTVQFATPEGTQTLSVHPGEALLDNARKGSPLTLQLNPEGEVVGKPELQIDLQLSDGTKTRPGIKMKLTGTVSRVKAGFSFLETSMGILMVSQKAGLRHAKAGEEVRIWMTEDHLVMDVKPKGASRASRRFITSKVVYASPEGRGIKLWTPEGEKTFPLPRGKSTRNPFRQGTPITVQLNQAGEVIDVRKAG